MTADNIDGSQDTATGLYGLDGANTYTVLCPVCDGDGKAFATKFASFKTLCRECDGLGEVVSE